MIAFLLKLALGGLNILKVIGAALRRFFDALNIQGWIGLIASLVLGFGWLHAVGEARHWEKQSAQFEKLYAAERATLNQTVANYRAAALQAQQTDAANAARVEAQQAQINERTADEFESRIAGARAAAQRLRANAQASADPGGGRAAPVPRLSAAPGGPAEAAGQDRLPKPDRLTATEQAIQLDELIKWARHQAAVGPNGNK